MPDSILVVTVGQEEEDGSFGFLQAEGVSAGVMDALIELAVSIGVEGWEGRPVGALFVVGDSSTVMEKSRQLTLNPFQGYSEDEKNIMNPDVRHALHAFAVLDGAFIVREDGVVVAAGRYLNFDEEKELDVPLGLGARHMAAAGISRDTEAIAIVVSQTSGSVRVFRRGKAALELAPARCGSDRMQSTPASLICGGLSFQIRWPSVRTRNLRAVRGGVPSSRWRAAPAQAQDAEKARQLFQQGSKYYDLGQFDKAIEAWQQGYDQKPDPGFLYNIAQAYRQKQDAAEGDLLLQGLPAELAQGAQPRRGRAEDRGAAEAARRRRAAAGTATRRRPNNDAPPPNNNTAAAEQHVDA